MITKFVLAEDPRYGGEDILGIYFNREEVEEAFYATCEDWVYETMMTADPLEVFGLPEWDWASDYKWLMEDCAKTLRIVEVPYYV